MNDDKASIRRRLNLQRSELSLDEARTRSARAQANLIADPLFAKATVIGLYRTLGREVDTEALHHAAFDAGKSVAYPEVLAPNLPMRFFLVGRSPRWFTSPLGFDVPVSEETILHDELDLVILPGLAFDREGRRLGRGAGHYDRTLELATNAKRVGLAFDFQLLSTLPEDPWDLRLHAVATESGMIEAPEPPCR